MLKNEKSSSSAGPEHIRTQVPSRDLPFGDGLNGRPVLRVEQDAGANPVRNRLLLESRPLHDLGKPLGKLGLAAPGSPDGTPERDNVRFLHTHPLYTNGFVRVNEPVCVTPHGPACSVIPMGVTQRKTAPQAKPSSQRVAIPGPDGKTLGQRVAEAMAYETGRRGVSYEQKDLVDDVNRLVAMEGDGGQFLSQQQASAIMRNKVSRSTFTPYIAKACHVDGVWLARGAGSMIPKV